jgi:hypothetical protein
MNLTNPFKHPTPLDVATKQLRFAQLQLLEANGAKEAAIGHVDVLEVRVKRLQETVQAFSTPSPSNTSPVTKSK